MPQFNQDANMSSLAGLTNDPQPSYAAPQQQYSYNPQGNPQGQEDYDLISLLNPEANNNQQTTTGNNDVLSRQMADLTGAIQQSLQLQTSNQQRDLEFRQQQLDDSLRRQREEQQRQLLASQQQQREELLNNLVPQIDENSIQLTPEEERTFGTSASFVRKIATQAQRDILNQMAPGMRQLAERQLTMQQTIDQMRNANQQQGMSAQQQQDLIIQAQVPNAGQLVADPRFAAFKQQPSAVAGFSNGDLIDMAYRNGRTPAVIAHLKAFQDVLAGKQPTVNVQGAPGTQPIQQQPRVQKLRRSEYDQAVEQFHMGLMDEATFNKIDAQFQSALVQGRVADL